MSDGFRLLTYSPLPEKRPKTTGVAGDINERRTDLRWTHGIGGGYLTLELGMSSQGLTPVVGIMPRTVDVDIFDHVELYHGGALLWEGRVLDIDEDMHGATGLVAEGYGISAMKDEFSTSTSSTSVGARTLLEAVFAEHAPLIRLGNADQFVTDGLANRARNAYTDLTPGDVIESIMGEGTEDDVPLWFMVDQERVAWLVPAARPASPDYIIPYDATVKRRRSARNMYGRVTVKYRPVGGASDLKTGPAENLSFVDTAGTMRHLLHVVGEMALAQAESVRDTELERRQHPDVAMTISRVEGRGMELPSGLVEPYYLVQSGRWVQLADDPDWSPIIAVTTNANNRSAMIECGELSRALPKNFLIRERHGFQKQARGVSPNRGGGRVGS